MESEEIRELNPLFEERERRRRAESLLSLVEAELDDAREPRRQALRRLGARPREKACRSANVAAKRPAKLT